MGQNRLVQINILNENGITFCQRHLRDGTVKQLELRDSSYTREQIEKQQKPPQAKEDMPEPAAEYDTVSADGL